MSEQSISKLNRTFEDYKDALKSYVEKYYPQISNDFDDSSIGSWLIDMVASIGDNLSYHIDRVYNETNIDSAQMEGSIRSIARTNGFKVPGAKGAMTEVKFSCVLPPVQTNTNSDSKQSVPDWFFAPKIRKGTKVMANSQYFEVMEDVDFAEQFNGDGVSDRTITPLTSNLTGGITGYTIEKLTTVVAGESKIFKLVLDDTDIKPFMEVLLPDNDIMNVESVIFKDGANYGSDPSMSEFMYEEEYISASNSETGNDTYRFFEVNSLLEQYRWGADISNFKDGNQSNAIPKTFTYGYYNELNSNVNEAYVPTAQIVKGEWKPLTQKFITEYTDKGYLKIIFGSGEQVNQKVNTTPARDFSKYQISNMVRNNFTGKLPRGGWTMYVLYRVGGGSNSNVAKGSIDSFAYLSAEIGTCIRSAADQKTAAQVKNSLKVENTIPSVAGKDAPTVDELRMMIKYNNASQERCVTLKDYENRIQMMPPKYGCPFRLSAIEENNKVMIYLLGLDYLGKLSAVLPVQLVKNIQNYLSQYRSINDYVEMKSGKIINVSFEADVYVDKNYNAGDVVNSIISTITDYMDINKHYLGEDIYLGNLISEIGNVDGVLNLIELRVYNEYGTKYSKTRTTQATIDVTSEGTDTETIKSSLYRDRIDISESDLILNSDSDTMYEIKYPDVDINVRVKTR